MDIDSAAQVMARPSAAASHDTVDIDPASPCCTSGRQEGKEQKMIYDVRHYYYGLGARCSSVVRAFAHGAMGHRIDPSWGGLIELFLVPASAP